MSLDLSPYIYGYGGGGYGEGVYGGEFVQATPLKPLPQSLDDLLASARITEFRFDLMERRYAPDGTPLPEAIVGVVDGVSEGSISWTYDASVKGAGGLVVIETGQTIDWITARIRPVAIMGEGENSVEIPLSIWIPSTPTENNFATHEERPIELMDKNVLLDQDVVEDPITHAAISFSVATGTNVMDTVRGLITGVGESAHMIPVTGDVTVAPMTWDVGVSRLKIINDLLLSVEYMSLWVDNFGRYRASPYVDPKDRPITYSVLAPFQNGRLVFPEWVRENDLYAIPNRFVALSQGSSDEPSRVSTAILAPESPYSYQNRGRWVTQTEEGVEAIDQTALDNYASRRLIMAASTTARRVYRHPALPDLRENNAVWIQDPDSDVRVRGVVLRTEIVFDPLGECETELSEVPEVLVND